MAKSARQYVFDGTELLPKALIPFVENRLENSLTGHWQTEVTDRYRVRSNKNGELEWDLQSLLKVMNIFWFDAFGNVLGQAERALVNELITVRNAVSHGDKFSYDDAERALDSMRRLMEAISAGELAANLVKMRDTILRTKFAELQRNEERKKPQQMDISVVSQAGLKPWREIVEPHQDVATGEFQQAEFAADLGKVYKGSAPAEYRDPKEFFSRTYLTDGLNALLVGAAKRLSSSGGDPVVELQTNFGGGKTHSMLALYHMAGESKASDLPGLDQLLSRSGLNVPDKVNRAVLVGTSRGPLDPINLEDGRKIQTTWGELAWQLGGQNAYGLIADNDKKGIAPGSNLLEKIFKQCAPSLILIDEWVAYLRQIYRIENLPSGSFDANLSFVQSLTEAVKASPKTLLVASLPASQIEVGGEGGQEALARLKQTFSRVESSWRPASQEESYEIVRRRLFKEISGNLFPHKDNTLKQFAKLYRDNPSDFPHNSSGEDYRRKLEKAYPIHPELFDQLYTTWGTLEKFQRTRGVLRLMAQVIHELWISNDPSVMIMPGNVAVNSERVEPELLHYLQIQWQSIIAGDVDGKTSTPFKIDQATPNLARHFATRRIARTIFMGTAPTQGQENRGLDDKQINLGVVQPGERPAIFGDALRRLSNQSKHLHSDLGRYWYSETPSLNRLAADKAGQIEEALVLVEIDKALAAYINRLTERGHFDAVQVAPSESSDVPDEADGIRAVVFGVAHPHTSKGKSDAISEAKNILMQRGNMPRVYRNTLIFLAAENRQLESLKDSVRSSLAWADIVKNKERLNLKLSDSALAESKKQEMEETVQTKLKEAWCYVLYPLQKNAHAEIEWASYKVSAQDGLLDKASKKLASAEVLLPEIGVKRLDGELQKYVWGDKDFLHLKELWEHLNRCVYLPRLKNQKVLVRTVQAAISTLSPGPFAYAEGWNNAEGVYNGLLIDKSANALVVIDADSLIVKKDVAERHRPKHETKSEKENGGEHSSEGEASQSKENAKAEEADDNPKRFVGTVAISSDRPARDMNQIVEAIVEQLTMLPGSNVSLKLEIDAEAPNGLDRNKVRVITENANALKFIDRKFT